MVVSKKQICSFVNRLRRFLSTGSSPVRPRPLPGRPVATCKRTAVWLICVKKASACMAANNKSNRYVDNKNNDPWACHIRLRHPQRSADLQILSPCEPQLVPGTAPGLFHAGGLQGHSRSVRRLTEIPDRHAGPSRCGRRAAAVLNGGALSAVSSPAARPFAERAPLHRSSGARPRYTCHSPELCFSGGNAARILTRRSRSVPLRRFLYRPPGSMQGQKDFTVSPSRSRR